MIEVTFDRLPDNNLSLNARVHWTVRKKLVEVARTEGKLLGLQAKNLTAWSMPQLAYITYRFYATTRGERDIENMIGAAKAWVDGLVDAGVLWKDSGWYLWIKGGELHHAQRPQTKLIIEERYG